MSPQHIYLVCDKEKRCLCTFNPSTLLITALIFSFTWSHQLLYQRRQFDRGAWWPGRSPWTSRTGGGRRPVGGSWRRSGPPPSGRTRPRSGRTVSRSISPRLRLDFEKMGCRGSTRLPAPPFERLIKLAFFSRPLRSVLFFYPSVARSRSPSSAPIAYTIGL